MNPFGSSEDDEDGGGSAGRPGEGRHGRPQPAVNHRNGLTRSKKKEETEYPGDLNPFGEEEDEEEAEEKRTEGAGSSGISSRNKEVRQRTTIDQHRNGYDDSLNPFGSDDGEDDDNDSSITTTTEPSSLASGSRTPVPKPRTSLNHHNSSIHSQPVSRETTPISLRRSIGSNVSRSSLDSRSRKTVIKPSVPPPPAPVTTPTDGQSGSRSPLRPHRSPKKTPAPRPRGQPLADKRLTLSPDASNSSQLVVTVPDSQSNERIGEAVTGEADVINPDAEIRVTGERESADSPTNCQIPVPAMRRISLTPSSAGSDHTTSTLSDLAVDSDHTPGNNNSSNHMDSRTDFHPLTQDHVVTLPAAQSSTSLPSLDVREGGKGCGGGNKNSSSSPSPSRQRTGMKKRPAPAPPQAIRRTVCGSLQSIQFDLNGIGDRLAIIQAKVEQLESAFRRDRAAASAETAAGDQTIRDQKEMIAEYLELARETCTLGRKQEELMYQRTEHKLEQEHADLEFNIRKIDLIPEFKRTPEDEKRSKDMIRRLVDVIDQRNDVVENMTKINKRPDFDKRVERLRKMCISESDLDSVLSAFLLANDMDVIATEMTGLTINQANGKGGSNNGSRIGDPESGKKKNKDKKDKKREKVIKSATLRLPHFKSKEKAAATAAAGDSLSSSSSPSNKGKSSTLRTIKKLGGGLRVKSPNSSSNKSATGSNREKE